MQGQRVHVDAAHGDPARIEVVEAHQQREQRRLARPGGADDGGHPGRRRLEGHVPQHLLPPRVGEGHALEPDVDGPGPCAVETALVRCHGGRDRRVERNLLDGHVVHRADPVHGAQPLLQGAHAADQLPDGPDEVEEVEQERDEGRDRQRAARDQGAAGAEHGEERHLDRQPGHGGEDRVEPDAAQPRPVRIVDRCADPRELGGLGAAGLHRPRRAERPVQRARHRGDGVLSGPDGGSGSGAR